MQLSRRSFLGLGAACALSGYVGSHHSPTTELTKISLRAPEHVQLKKDLTIGFITDIHLGPWLTREQCAQMIAPLADHSPDLILLGGDYIIGSEGLIGGSIHSFLGRGHEQSPYHTYCDAVSLCQELFKAPLGVYGVLGNHDRWVEPEQCARAFKEHNATLLVNQSTSIHLDTRARITLLGTDDFWTGESKVPSSTTSGHDYNVLLSHNPDGVQYLIDRGLDCNLALCGHTHGGQIKLPILGPILYNCRDARFREGLFSDAHMSVYTSRGIGTVELPVRINCPPEITLITIQAA